MAEYDDCAVSSISDYKNRSNQLLIEDALDDDNSVVRLSSQTMDKLELFCGDTVELKGKKGRKTICIVLSDDTCRDDRIRVNHVIQNNLQVHSGDVIVLQECPHVKYGKDIHVLPIEDTVNGIVGDLLKEYLHPYFLNAYRPVRVDDTFMIRMGTRAIEFKVIKTEPSPYCIVAPETIIHCEGEPIQREVEETLIDEIGFDDIGGLEDVKRGLQELIQHSIEHQEIYRKFHMTPTRGVLLFGPPGCGKTMLAKALAKERSASFISVNATELLSMSLDNTEDNMRDIFDKARQAAPCILFIDELDCFYNRRRDSIVAHGNVGSDRLINQFLTEIDGMSIQTKVFVIGATDRPDMIDPAILRPGRLEKKIYVPLPDEKVRHAILKIMLKKWPIAKDMDLTLVARVLGGLSGADIAEICRRACATAIRESIDTELSNPHNDSSAVNPMTEIRQDHFEKAMTFRRYSPSNNNIHNYELFAQRWSSPCSHHSSCLTFNYPQNIKEGGVKEGSTAYTDDDDLYA